MHYDFDEIYCLGWSTANVSKLVPTNNDLCACI